jgi:tetratricopeptide (TPR) repeat protein/DNA-binding CsgD family transcriptional regulator
VKLLFVILSLFILVAACQENKPEPKKAAQKMRRFDIRQTKNEFEQMEPSTRFNFLANVVEQPYDNKKDVDSFLRIAQQKLQLNDAEVSIEDLTNLQTKFFESNYEDAAYLFALKVLSTHKKRGDDYFKEVLPFAFVQLEYHASALNQLDSMSYYNRQLGQLLNQNSPSWIKVAFYSNKAFLTRTNGSYYTALILYNQALKHCSPHEKEQESYVYHSIANLYLTMKNYDKAYEYAQLSVKQVGFKNYPAQQLNMVGTIQAKVGKFNEAERSFKKVLAYSQREHLIGLEAQTLSNFGNLKRKQKKFDTALELMRNSDTICSSLGIEVGLLINGINRSELYLDQGQFEKAEKEMLEFLPLVTRVDEPKQSYAYFDLFSRIQDSLGNKIQANAYYRSAVENKEQSFGDNANTLLSQWELEQEKTRAQQEKLALELRVQKQEKTKYLVLFSSISIFLLGLVVGLLIIRKQQKAREAMRLEKQRVIYELELKSKELLAESLKNTTVQHVKNEIKQQLKEIQRNPSFNGSDEMQKLIQDLGKPENTAFFDEFETRFTGVHEDFYIALNKRCSNLTPHELKICALIRLNISSKEMARLTNRTVGTIDNTRSQIRKKLDLSETQNLQEFILNL